jgi:archaetidylinositol phosphate synthase
MWLGALGASGVFAAEIFAEYIDQAQVGTGEKAYEGIWGFDFDDILYLFAPVVWLDLHLYFVLGASVGAPAFALLTWWKWQKMEKR